MTLFHELQSTINFQVPSRVRDAMQMQVEAERKKRASILESEGMCAFLICEKQAYCGHG